MTIEEIAQAVAAEWKMSFGGIELDFALEVARRAAVSEREACAKVAEAAAVEAERVGKTHPEDSDSRGRLFARSRGARYISDEILARSNADVTGPCAGTGDQMTLSTGCAMPPRTLFSPWANA